MAKQVERPQQHPINIIASCVKFVALVVGWLLLVSSGLLAASLFYLTFASGETFNHLLEEISESPVANIASAFLSAQLVGLMLIAAARGLRSSAFRGSVLTMVLMATLVAGVSVLGAHAGA